MLSRARMVRLIEAYGADLQRWPDVERNLAQQYLDTNPELASELRLARLLDEQLSETPVPEFAGLEARLLAQALPERNAGLTSLFGSWLLAGVTHGKSLWWRPAVLACVPLLLGLYVGTHIDTGSDSSGWLSTDEELYWMALSEIAEVIP